MKKIHNLDALLAIIVLVVFGFVFIYYAASSVRFGVHWDEFRIIQSIQATMTTGVVLPGWYNYPSLSYLIGLITLIVSSIPDIISAKVDNPLGLHLAEISGQPAFRYLLRTVFVCLTAATATFTMLATRMAGTSWLAAALSGAILLSSFQVFYHSRWIAPDTLLMLACAMTLSASLWAVRKQRGFSLVLASIAAGLAVASKYTGGCLIFLPLFVALRNSARLSRVAIVVFVYFLTYIMITPGTVITPLRFLGDLFYEMSHYGKLGHRMFTVDPGFDHLEKIVDFLLFRISSQYWGMALFVFLSAIAGGFFAWRKLRWNSGLLIIIPVMYVFYLSSNTVMSVRNLLLLMPFIAVLAAIALDSIVKLTKTNLVHNAALLLFAALLTLNWPIFQHAANSIQDRDPGLWIKSINSYIVDHPGEKFALSPKVSRLLGDSRNDGQITDRLEEANAYLFALSENEKNILEKRQITNRRNLYTVIAGADDVDLDYYPNWSGLDRIVVVSSATAKWIAPYLIDDEQMTKRFER